MAYSIIIGERVEAEPEQGVDPHFRVNVIERQDAPVFDGDDVTGRSNHRQPSYGAWDDFTAEVGLRKFFHDKKSGLMRSHPGIVALKRGHLVVVRSARQRCESLSARPPGWGTRQDPNKARLIWLEWWMAWALDNCENPSIFNS